MTAAPPRFIFPARPINGGPLDKARPKHGTWIYEPKLNGWRTVIHAPTRTMWNRHGTLLSIAREFADALDALAALSAASGIEYFDCEGLERRHSLGHGALYILDSIPCGVPPRLPKPTATTGLATWLHRSTVLDEFLGRMHFDVLSVRGSLNRPDLLPGTLESWEALRRINREWSAEFYEGLVAKRADSPYPRATSATQETPHWMKHRWAF
jgi:hypothetical protein